MGVIYFFDARELLAFIGSRSTFEVVRYLSPTLRNGADTPKHNALREPLPTSGTSGVADDERILPAAATLTSVGCF